MRLVPLFLSDLQTAFVEGGRKVQHGADSCTLKLGHGSRDLLFEIGAPNNLVFRFAEENLFMCFTFNTSVDKRTACEN